MSADAPARRILVVVRHAKAEATGRRDRDRPLTERGRGDASAAGGAVAAAVGEPATAGRVVALVSSATRAYETWRQLADRLPVAVDVQVNDALYDASVDDVLGLVGGLDDGVSAAVVVGHNPTMHATVHTLAGGGDPAALARLDERGFPTGSVAVLASGGGWANLAPGGCHLQAFDVGRG